MKICAAGCEIYTLDQKTGKTVVHKPDEPFDIDDKEAERLIALGKAKKAGKDATPASAPPPPPASASDQGGSE